MSTNAPPEDPVFFTDRDLGKSFPRTLAAAGLEIRAHGDYFAPGASDETWLEAAGRKQWIAVTHDRRIRYKPNELAAVVRHRVGLLVVIRKAPLPDLATAFVATLPVIRNFVATHDRPFIACVYRGQQLADGTFRAGRIELAYPKQP